MYVKHMGSDQYDGRKGKEMKSKQTFILEVNSTENQSWQGKIEWIQGKKKQSFRSVMELLRLIDSVVYDGDEIAEDAFLVHK